MAFSFLSYPLISQISISLFIANSILQVSGLCLEDERSSLLLAFPNSLRPQSWSLNTDCCGWNGVRCNDSTGHVIHLDLANCSLSNLFNSSSLVGLSNLQTLDLSCNKFDSPIPTALFQLSSLTHLNLSFSAFRNQIPPDIGELNLLLLLDMSHNNLTGQIPPSIGNLTLLESLDLSENKLSGDIPQQMTKLTFLSVLNLSNNKLSGKIPNAGQLLTFANESFIGNPGLCGPPVSIACGTTDATPSNPAVRNDGSAANRLTVNWLLISVVLGYVVGLATVFRPLII